MKLSYILSSSISNHMQSSMWSAVIQTCCRPWRSNETAPIRFRFRTCMLPVGQRKHIFMPIMMASTLQLQKIVKKCQKNNFIFQIFNLKQQTSWRTGYYVRWVLLSASCVARCRQNKSSVLNAPSLATAVYRFVCFRVVRFILGVP